MNWQQILALSASIATTVAAVAVVVTIVLYYGQLRAMTRARELESLLVIMKYADDLELRRARYFMLEQSDALRKLLDTPYSWEARKALDARVRELSAGDLTLHNIDLSLNALNNICFLVRSGYAPVDSVDAFLKNSILHAWQAFEPYIRHRRSRAESIGEPSLYATHLEWVVVNRCNAGPSAPDRAVTRD